MNNLPAFASKKVFPQVLDKQGEQTQVTKPHSFVKATGTGGSAPFTSQYKFFLSIRATVSAISNSILVRILLNVLFMKASERP